MLTVVALIHIVVCLLIISLVLLQDPKNSGAGGVFGGGGSGSLLGATGAVTFLTRLTRYAAILFGVTCLILTLLSRPNTGSVIDSIPAAAQQPANSTGTNLNGANAASGATSAPAPSGAANGATGAPAPTGATTK